MSKDSINITTNSNNNKPKQKTKNEQLTEWVEKYGKIMTVE